VKNLSERNPGRHVAATEPDPRRPYKAIASALVAALAVLVTQGQDLVPPWVLLALVALLAGLTTFTVPNPERPS
jgi:hypothetical protein